MEYTIKPESIIQKTWKRVCSFTDDCFLSTVLFIAKLTKSEKLTKWAVTYTEKKMKKMQQQLIRMRWHKTTLDKAAASIHEGQSPKA